MTRKTTRKVKRLFAVVLTLAMVLTSVVWPNAEKASAAALTVNEDEYDVKSILSAKGDVLTSTQTDTVHVKDENGEKVYEGYIDGNTSTTVKAKYLKITYTIKDPSAVNDETELFNFQPYTSNWGGWQKNIIKYKDAIDNKDGSYTSYIAVRTIKASMDDDQECHGINLSFCNSEPTITLTGFYAMTIKSQLDLGNEDDVTVWVDENKTSYGHEPVQKIFLSQITGTGENFNGKYDYSKVSGQKITVYAKITKSSVFSRIKISGGNITDGAENVTSNKELIGIENTTNEKEQASTGGSGLKNNATYLHSGWGTTGGYGSGMGEKGTGIYKFAESGLTKGAPSGFKEGTQESAANDTQGMWLRRMSKDVEGYICGIKFGSVGSVTISEPNNQGEVTVTEGFDESKVESTAKDKSDEKPKSDAEIKSETEDELWAQLRKAKRIKKEDCLSEELYNDLQSKITAGQAALDAADATADSLTTALKNLNAAINSATSEAPLGLKKAIEYCEGLKEADYSAESFAKLAPAIAAAKEVYAVSGTKTDDELKAARDALEAVRVALVPKMSDAASNPKDFRILGKKDVVREMGAGINLGNTMDGGLYEVTETSWQAYKTTKAYIKALHDAGYNTVRIPVTWGAHINEDFTIKEAWINRVQEIVDYCVDQDMYAIINIHHDGAANHDDRGNNTPACWLDTYQWDIEKVYQKYQGVWKTIANRFKDYDEHLIFESMNEVTDAHKLASGQKNEDDKVLNALNQLFINTVRATGSNNTKRWLAITGRFATTAAITTMPEDTLADMGEVGTTRLMFSVHIYKGNSQVRWTYDDLKAWQNSLSSSIANAGKLDKNMPLYVGEYGVRTQVQSGSATGFNNAERALNYESCASVSDMYGAVPIVWDQGTQNYLNVKTETGIFTDWDRPSLKPVYDDVVHATIRGTYEGAQGRDAGTIMKDVYKSYGHVDEKNNDISKDPEIAPATDITLSATSLSMKAGEWTTVTAESNSARDMVIWSTDDDAVATVSRGKIHAKGTGITTIHVTTQLSNVVKDIKVIVASSGKETATAIKTDKPYYEITEGDTVDIKTTLTPEDSKDAITYTSSNTEIATVSSSGKITAENPGTTYIIASAASGVSTIATVKVNRKGAANTVSATLNLMFGSGLVEKSAPVTMTGDGQYTVTYDLAKDLSEEGKKANISKLEKLISVYLLDTNTLKPVVSSAKIRYDKLIVNDKELTLKTPEELKAMYEKNKIEVEVGEDGCFKNLLKASGQLDSNDPINGWDGCVVTDDDVTIDSKDHVVSFKNIDNPTKISLTFTIKDMKFFPLKEKTKEATELKGVTDSKFVLPAAGDTKEIELAITPADSDSEVTFYSTNSSVVAVNNSKVMVDAEGKIKINVTALSEGTATIVAITENGLKVFFSVGVGNMQVGDLEDPKDPTPPGLDGSEVPDPSVTPDPSATPDSSAAPDPSATPDSSATPAPSKTPDPNATPKPSTTPNPNGNGNGSSTNVTVAKKSVIIAAGKTVSVGFKAPSTPTVKSSNKKIATAKVKGTKIAISVPKKATKGSTAKITVKSGTKSAVIKVTVKNPAKKIKAAKKTLSVKKKKSVTAKFKITATNKKKAAADTIKVTSKKKKIAKVVKYSVKKGKATVKIKGLKKGKTTITLKIGKKSAKVTVKVK